jgi:HSP20 family protein
MMGDVFTDFGSMFDDIFVRQSSLPGHFVPQGQISENETHYAISLDMPGMKKEDIKVEFLGKRLTVTGERQRLGNMESTQKFARAFELPKAVDSSQIEAQYQDGVLNIAIPKAAEAQPRSIEIKSGSSGFFEKLLSPKKIQTESTPQEVRAS